MRRGKRDPGDAERNVGDRSASRPEGTTSINSIVGRSSGLRINLLATPSPRCFRAIGKKPDRSVIVEWPCVVFVPDYSGGSAVELHHLPCWFASRRTPTIALIHFSNCAAMRRRMSGIVSALRGSSRGLAACGRGRLRFSRLDVGNVDKSLPRKNLRSFSAAYKWLCFASTFFRGVSRCGILDCRLIMARLRWSGGSGRGNPPQ
jgi:hypothetical protein